MNALANAAFTSWNLNGPASWILLAIGAIYLRGWVRGRALIRTPADGRKLACFMGGLLLIFFATESPLDAFDNLYLSAHMTQHLLLMMFAPPLLLWSDPMVPLLRGLPKKFVKECAGPFLSWRLLRRLGAWFISPLVAWLLFAFSTIFWHLPKFYELALSSPFWHGAQHASFLWTGVLFWWPIVEPAPGKHVWPLWAKIPYLLFADLVNTGLSAFFVFSGRLLYSSYGATPMAGFSTQDDQTIAGLIMWVPGSLVYLLPAFAITMRVLGSHSYGHAGPVFERVRKSVVARAGFNWRALVRWRRAAQIAMLLLAIAVAGDGLFGTQVTPLNLAGVLPWIHWRALSVIALLVVGNLFCMTCPFVLVRDWGRKLLPARYRWPRRLRNKWLPAALLVLYLWCYEAFGLWDKPALTAWIIIGYFAAALLVDGFFRGASFCKYVCPIGQFHFVSSLVSPREVRVKSQSTCDRCRTYDCIRGNERARGCELDLFQPRKAGNLDCTFCLDCVNACPHDNVAILPVLPATTIADDTYRSSIGRLSKRSDLAALALVFVFGAFANAAGMVSPVMMWEHGWHARLGPHAMPLVVGLFIVATVVLAPAGAYFAAGLINRLGGKVGMARRFAFTLVPLGFAMWAAHLLYHFLTFWTAPAVPALITDLQIVLLDGGLLLTLYVGWRIVRQIEAKWQAGVALLAPWAAVAIALYCAGAWILFQPMQMRGMMMQ